MVNKANGGGGGIDQKRQNMGKKSILGPNRNK